MIYAPLSLLERKIAMGTCVSKCCSNPSLPFDPSPPQDKLVISQSPSTDPTNPLPNDLSNIQSTPSSSSSTSPSSSSSSSSSSCSTSNSTYSQSSSKGRSFTNEFLLSCARENPHVIILDPHKHCAAKPKPNRHLVKTLPQPSKLVQAPHKQPTARANQALPAKRGRSTSPPTLVGRKSSKTELSSAVPPTYRKLSTPSIHRRSTNALTERQRPAVGMSGNAVPLRLAANKEKLLCSSPCNSSNRRQISGVEKRREACMHQIHQRRSPMGQNGSREVFSEESSRIPHMEDLNNPLMYVDCFIFL